MTNGSANSSELTQEEQQKAQQLIALFTASFMKSLQHAPGDLIDDFGNLHNDFCKMVLIITKKLSGQRAMGKKILFLAEHNQITRKSSRMKMQIDNQTITVEVGSL